VLNFILGRRGWLRVDADARRRLPRIALATIVMAGVLASVTHAFGLAEPVSSFGRLVVLAALVMVGIGIYLATLQLLGVMKLKELAASVRQRA
jgi:putative peptidoglycan lipid II flippase